MHVLLVEDDAMLGAALRQALLDAHFTVALEPDGRAAAEHLRHEAFDLMVLDLGLPSIDGREVLAVARGDSSREPDLPVIVISARHDLPGRIAALDEGADDYLVKPFSAQELLARIRALIRRRNGRHTRRLGTANVELDLVAMKAKVGETEHRLSSREFALLRALLGRPGAILSRAELEEKIYGSAAEIESNVVEFIIHSLRRKLGPDIIRNVRGLGWYVSPD